MNLFTWERLSFTQFEHKVLQQANPVGHDHTLPCYKKSNLTFLSPITQPKHIDMLPQWMFTRFEICYGDILTRNG